MIKRYNALKLNKKLYAVCKAAALNGIMPNDCRQKDIAEGVTDILCHEFYCVHTNHDGVYYATKDEAITKANEIVALLTPDERTKQYVWVTGPDMVQYQPLVEAMKRSHKCVNGRHNYVPATFILTEEPYPVCVSGDVLFEALAVVDDGEDLDHMSCVTLVWRVTHEDATTMDGFYDLDDVFEVIPETKHYNAMTGKTYDGD